MKITIPTRQWKDKETGIYFIYSEKYDITGYGKRKYQAENSFEVAISEILLYSKPKKK